MINMILVNFQSKKTISSNMFEIMRKIYVQIYIYLINTDVRTFRNIV